jgi:hypothetical protein
MPRAQNQKSQRLIEKFRKGESESHEEQKNNYRVQLFKLQML